MTNGSLPISAGGFSLEKGEMPRQSVYQTVSRPTTSIEQLKQHGQSIWLDFIGRGVVRQGEFERLIADDGPTGVTGNPETFDRVIAEGRDYDDVFEGLAQIDSHIDAQAIYERIAIVDVRMAADALRTVFDRTHGVDGFASIGICRCLKPCYAVSISTRKPASLRAALLWRSPARRRSPFHDFRSSWRSICAFALTRSLLCCCLLYTSPSPR